MQWGVVPVPMTTVGAHYLEIFTKTIMSVSLEVNNNNKNEDLGKILAKVQDDLQYLRAAFARASDGDIDSRAVELALTRTEHGLQVACEQVEHSSSNNIVTLPSVKRDTAKLRETSTTGAGGRSRKSMKELVSVAKQKSPIKRARRHQPPAVAPNSLSPGQQAQVQHISHLMSQPTHPLTHQILSTHYGLPVAATGGGGGGRRESTRLAQGQIVGGPTTSHLTTLPRANRRDAQLTPPSISQDDARKGLLSLLERGLIPPAADIVLSPPPVKPRALPLHSNTEQHQRQRVAEGLSAQLAGVRLDLTATQDEEEGGGGVMASTSRPIWMPSLAQASQSTVQSRSKASTGVSVKTLEIPEREASRPLTPPNAPPTTKQPSSYRLVIQNGTVVDVVKEYAVFKQAYRHRWTSIQAVLCSVEELCRNYSIPMAIVDGYRLADMAAEYELGLRPSKQDVLDCLTNMEEVQQLVTIPGRRYKGFRGLHAAATKIQATYRMSVRRREYLEHRRRKWAAGIVSLSWIMYAKVYKIRQQLKLVRARQLENHRTRAMALRRRWTEIGKSKRTIVHIPSLGYAQSVRAKLEQFHIQQSLQLARLSDVKDPNVDVVYVSPRPVDSEVLDYYHKLLAMGIHGDKEGDESVGGAIGKEFHHRIHIVTPELAGAFAHHNLSLSTELLYSPNALQRIQHLTAGREAYIVPGVVSRDDIAVADALGLPLLASEPELSQLYSTKSGAKRIFADASVHMPPSVGDIFSQDQLVEKLASLVASHPLIQRWIFKLQTHIAGKGFAYCDVTSHLSCHLWVVKESQRYGAKWSKKWAQENAIKRILAELPDILESHVHPVDGRLFPTWAEFQEEFFNQGGIIEGVPPSESTTALTVDVLIEPDGVVNILSSGDQICSAPFEVWGVSVPQSSVPTDLLTKAVRGVASSCRARGIIGHFSVDFVTFIDPYSLSQELWAVDLDLGLSDHLALHRLTSYLTGASYDVDQGALMLPSGGSCYAIYAPRLLHTNLSLLYFNIFFQMCKAHFIGFDPKECVGTVFALVDGQRREHLGMMCVEHSLVKVVESCSSNLSIIHQEISTPHMQGTSNFQAACKELDTIAELVRCNEEESSSTEQHNESLT